MSCRKLFRDLQLRLYNLHIIGFLNPAKVACKHNNYFLIEQLLVDAGNVCMKVGILPKKVYQFDFLKDLVSSVFAAQCTCQLKRLPSVCLREATHNLIESIKMPP